MAKKTFTKSRFIKKNDEPVINIEKENDEEINRYKDIYNILGSMMTDKIFCLWCFKYGINLDLFPTEKSSVIFAAIKQVCKAGLPVDILSVTEKIKASFTVPPVSPYLVASCTNNVNLAQAYAFCKKVLGLREHKSVVIENLNSPFKPDIDYSVKYIEFLESPEFKNTLKRLTDPSTNNFDRQFCAGFIRAIEVLNSYMKEKEEPVEVLPIRPVREKFPFTPSSASFDEEAPF